MLRGAAVVGALGEPRGRYVVAERTLMGCRTVCVSSVHALALTDTAKRRVCARCFTMASSGALPYRCESCGETYYCSEECAIRHRTDGGKGSVAHRHTCPALARFDKLLLKYGPDGMAKPRMMLEILARRALAVSDEDRATVGRFEALEHHAPTPANATAARAWVQCCDAFLNAVERCDWCDWTSAATRPSRMSMRALLSRIECNVFDAMPHSKDGYLAEAMYLEASMFNHSCEPNCTVAHSIDALEIYTLGHVAAGEELTISYIADLDQSVARRREVLRAAYGFDCRCPRCEREAVVERSRARWQLYRWASSGGFVALLIVSLLASFVTSPSTMATAG